LWTIAQQLIGAASMPTHPPLAEITRSLADESETGPRAHHNEPDMLYLAIFGTVALALATPLFKRTL